MGENAAKQSRRLFVCCDGTWNNASGTFAPLTNVARLARSVDRFGREVSCALENDEPPLVVPQLVYYSSGVGAQAVLSAESGFAGLTGEGRYIANRKTKSLVKGASVD